MSKNKKIGLLGGSFNPAHGGHLHISLEAIRRLALDEVWWLVSLQNPLKSTKDMAGFDKRFNRAKDIVRNHPNIKISDFEQETQSNYTDDNLTAIKERYPDNNFIWLMGADSLINFHKWHNWQNIFNQNPIAVFDRGGYKQEAMLGDAAINFKNNLVSEEEFAKSDLLAPIWCFVDIDKHPASSTDIRKNSGSW